MLSRGTIPAAILLVVFSLCTQVFGQPREYDSDCILTVNIPATDPDYDPARNFSTINRAIAVMEEKALSPSRLGVIYVWPNPSDPEGAYYEHLNRNYVYPTNEPGVVYYYPDDVPREGRCHNVPSYCDLIGMGSTRDRVIIKHCGTGTDYDGMYEPGVNCINDNVVEHLKISNYRTGEDYVQSSVRFNGKGELRDCIVHCCHGPAVIGRGYLVVLNCEITSYFMACIMANSVFSVSDCHLYPAWTQYSETATGVWPCGILVYGPGTVSGVTITASGDTENGYSCSTLFSMAGIQTNLRYGGRIMISGNTQINLALRSIPKENNTEVLALDGIVSAEGSTGVTVVGDCTINVKGNQTDSQSSPFEVRGIRVLGGTVEVWGHTTINTSREGQVQGGQEYDLTNENGTLAVNPDPYVVRYDQSKTNGSITGLVTAVNITRNSSHCSIQDAVDKAVDGDIIEGEPGIHYESVSVYGKRLELRGRVDPDAPGLSKFAAINAGGIDSAFLFSGCSGSVLSRFMVTNAIHGVKCDNAGITIENNWIYGNEYGVCSNGASSAVNICNNTVVDNNSCGVYAAFGAALNVSNCILWNNGDDLFGCNATYSCISDGDPGSGNISSDPNFVDPNDRDYHLQPGSPCVDAGNAGASYFGTDIDGDERIIGGEVDLGADEVFVRARNVDLGISYLTIQEAIDGAGNGNTIEVCPGEHHQTIEFHGRAITLRSVNPADWNVVSSTVIAAAPGAKGAVVFGNGEGGNSVLWGFTIRGEVHAVYCVNQSSPTIHRCIVENANTSGIFLCPGSSPLITGCRIGNNGYSGVAALYSKAIVENSWIHHNMMGVSILGTLDEPCIVRNCTIVNNIDKGVRRLLGGSATPLISNCIISDNNDDLYNCSATYSCILHPEDSNGLGSITCNPMFVDAQGGDYHLSANSPCIDTGNPAGDYNGQMDIDDEARVKGSAVDIGADESNEAIDHRSLTVSSTSGGSVTSPGQGLFKYDHGTAVSIKATSQANYHFVNWTGTAVDSGKVPDPNAASTTVTADADYTLRANFAIDQRTLTISSTAGGSVSTPGQGAFQYDHGTPANVVATPQADYYFVNWTGTAVDSGKVPDPNAASTTVTADADYTLQANFAEVPPDPLSEALDTSLGFTTGGDADWSAQTTTYYYDGDAAWSGDISHSQESWMQITVNGPGTVSFYWKVSSETNYDFLEFYIDGIFRDRISGSVDWTQKTYLVVSSGSHTLKWRYYKDGSVDSGSDCGWVDKVEWEPNPVISGYVWTSGGSGISGVSFTFSNGGGSATSTCGVLPSCLAKMNSLMISHSSARAWSIRPDMLPLVSSKIAI
jgi:hypothetical protein